MYLLIDTNVLVFAVRITLGFWDGVDRHERRRIETETRAALALIGREVVIDGGAVVLTPMVNATVLTELVGVLNREGATREQVKQAFSIVANFIGRNGGKIDHTGKQDAEYRRSMSARSRDNWGTGAGDEAVLDTATRYGAIILTEDRNFAAYAKRRGTKTYTSLEVATWKPVMAGAA